MPVSWGLSDSPLCLCVHVFIHVYVQLNIDVVRGCMHGACMRVCALNFVMIICASQIHDVLVSDTLSVGIL